MRRQLDWKQLKWGLGVGALAIAIFGCAGNTAGGSSTGSTATSGSTASSGSTATSGGLFPEVATVNLSNTPALLQYVFLTGAGRAPATEVAIARNMAVSDNFGIETSDLTEKTLTLTSNQSQILATNVGLLTTESRNFTSVDVNMVRYDLIDDLGTRTFNNIQGIPGSIPSEVRIFKGRETLVPLFMDGSTINTETQNIGGVDTEVAVFDRAWFDSVNRIDGDTTVVRGFLSDYVCFDVSSISSGLRPTLSQGLGTANRIFFSGDGYALGAGNPSAGVVGGAPFETIFAAGQDASVVGRYSSPATLPSGIGLSVTPGSYTTLGVDPTDVTTTDPVLARKITSFQGTWRPHFQQRQDPSSGLISDIGYLRNAHSFEAISIPSSLDDERQDVVFVNQTIGTAANGAKFATITSMMWGYIDMGTKQIFLYPIANIGDSNAITNRTGEVAGTISTQYSSTGTSTVSPQKTRWIDFSFTTPAPGFPASGKIVVLRR
ncbi:MAG: hypothetical protein QE269_10420 [Fimbriimonas sp.]|nr:hypothetical protein [Fimbriimonas sp.]